MTGKTPWAGTKRMGVSVLADALYSGLGMNDEDVAADHLKLLREEGFLGDRDDQMTEEEARQWLLRAGPDAQSGARGELLKTGAAYYPSGLLTNMFTPILEHWGTPWTGGRRDIMKTNANMVRDTVNTDIYARARMRESGGNPDVVFGYRKTPQERYPLNSDDELSKNTILKPFVNNLDQFDSSQGYFGGITDYITGGQERPVEAKPEEPRKYPARGY
jgi:hypothetical protein